MKNIVRYLGGKNIRTKESTSKKWGINFLNIFEKEFKKEITHFPESKDLMFSIQNDDASGCVLIKIEYSEDDLIKMSFSVLEGGKANFRDGNKKLIEAVFYKIHIKNRELINAVCEKLKVENIFMFWLHVDNFDKKIIEDLANLYIILLKEIISAFDAAKSAIHDVLK